MPKHPTSYRKAASSFVGDGMQETPRSTFAVDRNDSFPVTSLEPNLIGDSILVNEGSRAVSVSKTGETHFIPLDEDVEKSPRNEQFFATLAKGDGIKTTTEALGNQSLTESSAPQGYENKLKNKKRNKAARLHSGQKARLTFTPRRCGASYSTHALAQSWSTSTTNVETQTNLHLDVIPPRQIKSLSNTNFPQSFSKYNTASPMQQCQQLSRQTLERISRPISNSYIDNYSELRVIVSFLTLVTVISWFISAYFEFEILSDIFDSILQTVRNWCLGHKKPKTKMEIFIEFLKDLIT